MSGPGLFLVVGRIAQLVEQLTLNQRVAGSSPAAPTNEINALVWFGRTALYKNLGLLYKLGCLFVLPPQDC